MEAAKFADLARQAREAGESEFCQHCLVERDLLLEQIDNAPITVEPEPRPDRDLRGNRAGRYGALRVNRAARIPDPALDEAKALRAEKREAKAIQDGLYR